MSGYPRPLPFLLRHMQLAPNGAHIENFDHMNACAARPAFFMVDRFTQTLDQVFAELVQKIASMPLRRITLSSTSAGPVGRLAPRSSCET